MFILVQRDAKCNNTINCVRTLLCVQICAHNHLKGMKVMLFISKTAYCQSEKELHLSSIKL